MAVKYISTIFYELEMPLYSTVEYLNKIYFINSQIKIDMYALGNHLNNVEQAYSTIDIFPV